MSTKTADGVSVRPSLVFVGLAGAALVALGAAGMVIEARPFISRAAEPAQRIARYLPATGNATRVSLLESRFARTAQIDTCLKTLSEAATSLTTPRSTIDALNKECLAIAEAAAARSPAEANLWLIAADLAAGIGDYARATRYLEESYKTGPNEQWIAERRALFAYPLRDRLGAHLRSKIDRDFALLLRTERGVTSLAALYWADAEIREYLTSIALNVERPFQERFVARVRQASEHAAE